MVSSFLALLRQSAVAVMFSGARPCDRLCVVRISFKSNYSHSFKATKLNCREMLTSPRAKNSWNRILIRVPVFAWAMTRNRPKIAQNWKLLLLLQFWSEESHSFRIWSPYYDQKNNGSKFWFGPLFSGYGPIKKQPTNWKQKSSFILSAKWSTRNNTSKKTQYCEAISNRKW